MGNACSQRTLWQYAGPVFHLRGLHATLQHHGTIKDAEGAVFMSVSEFEQLLYNYRTWLKDKTTLRQVNGEWVEITTPYLDRHNDALQIYVRAENGGYVL